MNRKISTLFTAGLLMAGSLCGSAWAEKITLPMGVTPIKGSDLKSGQEVFMSVNDLLYGFTDKDSKGMITDGSLQVNYNTVNDEKVSVSTQVAEEDLADYIWTVTWSTSASEYPYTLKNKATGDVLRINKTAGSDGAYAVELNTTVDAEETVQLFIFEGDGESVKYNYAPAIDETAEVNPSLLTAFINSNTKVKLSWTGVGEVVVASATSDGEGSLLFYAVETPELKQAEELNALYNGKGFSFGVSTPDDKPLEGNLFGDQRIVAKYVGQEGINVDVSTPSYVSQMIPSGMYFFVGEAPASNSYSAWLNATVLVASSYETIEATVSDRKEGQGYELKAMKIKDLNLYVKDEDPNKDWMSQGKQVSILNACFKVEKTFVGDYPYALTLPRFRYQADASKAEHKEKEVRLNVIGHASTNYLATQEVKDGPKFIFKLAASGMQKAIDLLNKEAKASVYSIRVLDANKYNTTTKIDKKDIRSAYGKYLTNSIERGSFNFVAKAKVLTTNTPAYQWSITDIDVNTQDVTFTNRETDESFTAKLFPVEGQANVYELAVSKINADDTEKDASVVAVYVDQNTYKEATETSENVSLDKMTIELKSVEVDPYAGFLNVDDKTLVTMAFARDNHETSNKWYAAVMENKTNTSDYKLCAEEIGANHEYFVTESSQAAQWQLIKKNRRSVIARSFVYNDNGVAVVAPKADVAYAYEYQLQYVVDGEETHHFFAEGEGDKALTKDNTEKFTNATKFIIKKNADESVYLIDASKLTVVKAEEPTAFDEDIETVVDVVLNNNKYEYASNNTVVYAIHSDDKTLNTYLIPESPEVSYPAEEGYVYMESELGNYISMNEDRDGIVVNENPFNLFLHVTDKNAVIPSFYISKGIEGSSDRAFLFHPQDSVNYYVADGKYDKKYSWNTEDVKAIFKAGQISESRDTMATMIKGELKNVAVKADDEGTFGGLKNFKFQIVLADDADDMYVVRSLTDAKIKVNENEITAPRYLYAVNEKLTWAYSKSQAMKFKISEGDPTSNESIADAAEGVKVIAGNGIVEIQGAAGKKVSVKNVLGKPVAETVLTSDNATIAAPAGIVIVAVEGEEAVKAVVK
ncbi:DUF6383 domain-containing protein [Parabacteroides sp.]